MRNIYSRISKVSLFICILFLGFFVLYAFNPTPNRSDLIEVRGHVKKVWLTRDRKDSNKDTLIVISQLSSELTLVAEGIIEISSGSRLRGLVQHKNTGSPIRLYSLSLDGVIVYTLEDRALAHRFIMVILGFGSLASLLLAIRLRNLKKT